MYNDDTFWETYKEFQAESHDRHSGIIENFFQGDPYFNRVLDIGCGKFCNSAKFFITNNYFGIDQLKDIDIVPPDFCGRYFYKDLSFTKFNELVEDARWYKPNIFVSSFACEVVLPVKEKYELYTKLFSEVSSIRYGVVSGFYYRSKKDQEVVEETGGLKSYQTIEDLYDVKNDVFSEIRTLVHAPSKMFGEDVVEVWKLLERK